MTNAIGKSPDARSFDPHEMFPLRSQDRPTSIWGLSLLLSISDTDPDVNPESNRCSTKPSIYLATRGNTQHSSQKDRGNQNQSFTGYLKCSKLRVSNEIARRVPPIRAEVGTYSVLLVLFDGALQASSGCGHPLSLTSGTHHRKHFLSTQRFAFTSSATIQANAKPSLPLHEPHVDR